MDGLRVPPSQPGVVTCLKCRRSFKSDDRIRIRICDKCKRDKERVGLIAERVSSVHGLDVYDVDGYDCKPPREKPVATPKPRPEPKPKPPPKPRAVKPKVKPLLSRGWDF